MKRITCGFLLLLLTIPPTLLAQQAPTSQPSKREGFPKVACSDWEKLNGREGTCEVETETTTWRVKYYAEGERNLSWKGKLKNLMVLLPGDDMGHKFPEWWDAIVGKGKPIDTEDWHIISLSRPGDEKPDLGNPLLLNTDEMADAQMGVIDYLYPKRKDIVVGGPSRGGDNATLLAIKFPKKVRSLFMVHSLPLVFADPPSYTKYLEELIGLEMTSGPFVYWKREKKEEWWLGFQKLAVELNYTDQYFLDPKWTSEHGFSVDEYSSPEKFKEKIAENWTSWSVDNSDPQWMIARLNAWSNTSFTKKDFTKLPDDILILQNKNDRLISSEKVMKFTKLLKKLGKDVRTVMYEDLHGHMSCCQQGYAPQTVKKAINEFL